MIYLTLPTHVWGSPTFIRPIKRTSGPDETGGGTGDETGGGTGDETGGGTGDETGGGTGDETGGATGDETGGEMLNVFAVDASMTLSGGVLETGTYAITYDDAGNIFALPVLFDSVSGNYIEDVNELGAPLTTSEFEAIMATGNLVGTFSNGPDDVKATQLIQY